MKIIKPKKIILFFLFIAVIFTCFYIYSFSGKNKIKILLVGLDGASWNVMTPLIKEGKLPNIKQLMNNGSWGNLESLSPFISEVVWTTIATGQEPEKHGILDRLMEDPDTKEPVTVTSNLRKTKAIWNILSQFKKK